VNAHSQLQLWIVFQFLADLDRTPRRRFWTFKKNQRHPIANGKSNQFPCFFGNAELFGTTDNLSEVLHVLTLLVEKQLRITDQIHEQNVPNL